jgi:hypothetical protein
MTVIAITAALVSVSYRVRKGEM